MPIMHRRGFLTGLIAVVSAPMIVRAESLMPIKVTDTYHPVILEGVDMFGKAIKEIINVPETLKDGLDMRFYVERCKIIRPQFSHVEGITWGKSMPLRRTIEKNGWTDEELIAMDECGRQYADGFNKPGKTAFYVEGDNPVFDMSHTQYERNYRVALHLPKS